MPIITQRDAGCPCGGRKPAGFSSLCESYCEAYPDSGRESAMGRQNTVMRSAPAGAKTRRVFIPL
ncbi:MAG: hypothetical protein LBK61_13490 [Spirochaetaceae bacterium]|nr:hypothetical protein [Spirochaetaceae bacterium]